MQHAISQDDINDTVCRICTALGYNTNTPPFNVKREEAAKALNIPTGTLANMAMRGEGPEFVRIGRSVRYPLSSLARYLVKNIVRHAGEVA
ncbi:MAG: helix-turn-helix domain-containing protein [Candidatus Sedimenticola sp. (ex Thyasira tokunagai)]